MNSTLGSVVPLAMFLKRTHSGAKLQTFSANQQNRVKWICFIFRENIYQKQVDSDKVGTCTSSVAASKHKY